IALSGAWAQAIPETVAAASGPAPRVPACQSIWTAVPSPSPGSAFSSLLAVSGSGPSDAWAVGYYTDPNGLYLALAEHWNGSAWSVVPSPNPGTSSNLLQAV